MSSLVKQYGAVRKAGWRVGEYQHATGLSRSLLYEKIADGSLTSVKIGVARVILTPPEDFLHSYGEQPKAAA
jgi:hypothetical protein